MPRTWRWHRTRARAAHADRGNSDHRRGDWRGSRRHAAGGRDHVQRLRRRLLRPDLQPRGQAALHVRGRDTRADDYPHDGGRREGSDISAITYGWQVQECLTAAEELQKEGVSLEVIDLRTLVPLDYHRVLESVKK